MEETTFDSEKALKEARDFAAALKGRPLRVYADGIFDLFHFGHALALKQCKDLFPGVEVYVLAGVCSDAITFKNKGKTVMTEKERYESHCKWVDEVVVDAPWIVTTEFIEKHRIDYVIHDPEPYPSVDGLIPDVYGPIKQMHKFVASSRTDGISTTDLINRLLMNRDDYIKRNVKRGYKFDEMNVSSFRVFIIMLDIWWDVNKQNIPLIFSLGFLALSHNL